MNNESDNNNNLKNNITLKNVKLTSNNIKNDKNIKNIVSNDKKRFLKSRQRPDERWVGDRRIFVCLEPGCNSTFNTRFSLKRHHKKHTGERPYMCGFLNCGRKFAEKSTLKRHMRTHTGESPYKCTINKCRKSFNDRIKLKRHMLHHAAQEDPLIKEKIEALNKLPDRIKWTHEMIEKKIIKLDSQEASKPSPTTITSTTSNSNMPINTNNNNIQKSVEDSNKNLQELISTVEEVAKELQKQKDIKLLPCPLYDCSEEFPDMISLYNHCIRCKENKEILVDPFSALRIAAIQSDHHT